MLAPVRGRCLGSVWALCGSVCEFLVWVSVRGLYTRSLGMGLSISCLHVPSGRMLLPFWLFHQPPVHGTSTNRSVGCTSDSSTPKTHLLMPLGGPSSSQVQDSALGHPLLSFQRPWVLSVLVPPPLGPGYTVTAGPLWGPRGRTWLQGEAAAEQDCTHFAPHRGCIPTWGILTA